MQRGAWIRRAGVSALVLASVAACHRAKHYETNVEITRQSAVRKDENGKILTLDFEMGYVECPGTQLEVVRGDASFASCVSKYKVGDKVKIGLDHTWSAAGYYTWVVTRVGDCDRKQDPNDEASFALVRECEDWTINGAKVGFNCKYTPEKHLIDKCPWFRRR